MNDVHALPKLCCHREGAGAGDQALKNAWRIRGTFPKVEETLHAACSPRPRASVPRVPPLSPGPPEAHPAPRLPLGGLTRGPGCGAGRRLRGAPATFLSLWAAASDWLGVRAPPLSAPPRAPPALPPAEGLGDAVRGGRRPGARLSAESRGRETP